MAAFILLIIIHLTISAKFSNTPAAAKIFIICGQGAHDAAYYFASEAKTNLVKSASQVTMLSRPILKYRSAIAAAVLVCGFQRRRSITGHRWRLSGTPKRSHFYDDDGYT